MGGPNEPPKISLYILKDPGGRILLTSGGGTPEHLHYADISSAKPIKLNHVGVSTNTGEF